MIGSSPERFDAESALRPLKAFQRATVDHVAARLLTDTDRVTQFLVADEVGLGKTMVARGVIARTIEALQGKVPRIDIVYICSNAAIARQNVKKLDVLGDGRAHVLPTRLTMLALELARVGGIRPSGVNFYSLTPGTSLDLKESGGRKEERALILRMLSPLLRDAEAANALFQGWAGVQGWATTRSRIDARDIEKTIEAGFREAVLREPELLDRLEILASKATGPTDSTFNSEREALVGRLRTLLAQESAHALKPDLIVLDEFQRFQGILTGTDEAADLARRLFGFEDNDGNRAKTLLLSATPYRMLNLEGDADRGEEELEPGDHYREFLTVLEFLYGPERAPGVRAELESEMRRYRAALGQLPLAQAEARGAARQIEANLRQVIARTERVSETATRDGMVCAVTPELRVTSEDLYDARAMNDLARAFGAADVTGFWKSAPYLLSFLRDYDLAKRIDAAKDAPTPAQRKALRAALRCQLSREAVEAYEPIDPGNARMRALMELAFADGLGQRLWMPPSLPSFGATRRGSKLLIFSDWQMVPDAIAALLSYEAERRMGLGQPRGAAQAHSYSDPPTARPLRFAVTDERLAGLRVLPLMVPSPHLARAVDPLALSQDGPLADYAALRAQARTCLEPLAEGIIARSVPADREVTWDWAGTTGEDLSKPDFAAWLAPWGAAEREGDEAGWREHLSALRTAGRGSILGQQERTVLLDHLTDLALGSPATCALRALARHAPDLALDDPLLLSAATKVAMGFRRLFNMPDAQALLRSEGDETYWRAVLDHCARHDLSAVLDEYLHVLREAEGLAEYPSAQAIPKLAEKVVEALSLRPAQIDLRRYELRGNRIVIDRQERRRTNFRMRGRFATRLVKGGSSEDGTQRVDQVRQAFNSPFRPFVLASTSIGQEGLDFHLYCHRVVHWNLPGNPVDIEQREGRVNRYKNHAVRLNLAQAQRGTLTSGDARSDPWVRMFEAARAGTEASGDMVPFWLLEGDHKVERHVLSLPFSRESTRLGWLNRTVALYRLAFGQPRQDDLLAILDRAAAELSPSDLDALQISLRPNSESSQGAGAQGTNFDGSLGGLG
ncbi:helicase-related protein [Sedimentimonas flavescens]|uniref:helicase-related protein n=1 Tax=Sedimentimonas flavescens TaxID=2851012 RepID=UPI0021A87827|nr:helicase-related protein [Sedimentimonas flavescens]MCT2538760.1 helicase-related protein [Sedimentimonas flavescens]